MQEVTMEKLQNAYPKKDSKHYVSAIIIISLLISWLHYSTVPALHAQHDIYREFYCVPVFMGALAFGLKGAALSYLLVVALYVPYIFLSWTGSFAFEANKFLHLILQGLLALSAGILIDRDRRSRLQLQKEQYLSGIGQAASAIVHDLRSPLVTILGFARRLQEGKGKQDSNIQAIIDSAHGMERIVNDVPDFAKPIRLDMQEEDLRQVVSRACDVCRAKAEEAGVSVSCDSPPAPVKAAIDHSQMERAIANLLSNAIEASGKGQTVIVSMEISGHNAVLTVKDHGPGMDKETLENIFIPFYTTKSKGTGLGMPIVKKIIDAHRGAIHIQSQPEEGTEVLIELPHNL